MRRLMKAIILLTLLMIVVVYVNFVAISKKENTNDLDNNVNNNLDHNVKQVVAVDHDDDDEKKDTYNIKVNVNNLKTFNGLYMNNDLYVPLDFLKSYYEIDGYYLSDNRNDNLHQYYWSHTPLGLFDKKNLDFQPFESTGEYLNFKSSDVANRGRVKYISGIQQVPVTTQWDKNGYFYPIQIAQYGLSHLSKYYAGGYEVVAPEKKAIPLPVDITGQKRIKINYVGGSFLQVKFNRGVSSFTVRVHGADAKKYTLKYVVSDHGFIKKNEDSITHGIGNKPHEGLFHRDLSVDLSKGISYVDGKKEGLKLNMTVVKVTTITFEQIQFVAEATIGTVDHRAIFLTTANWFVRNQDEAGGWPTNVTRNIMKGMSCPPGWYSAMGQGQAISLLSRVYTYIKDQKYLNAALKATKVFHIASNSSGVKAILFDKYPWFEEYPVKPSQFVLNGFIYSLLGLYDLSQTAVGDNAKDASFLFQQGISSLETLLPLFDSGQGSFYDLRHVTIPGHPPNRARWQYHKVHLELLHALHSITKSKQFYNTYERWLSYARGVPSRHN